MSNDSTGVDKIDKAEKLLKESFDIFKTLIDILPEIFFVLDRERKVIFANKALYHYFGGDAHKLISTLSPGELLRCDVALKNKDKCGNTPKCDSCGISRAFLSSTQGKTEIHECKLMLDNKDDENEEIDLKIWATPCVTAENFYIIFYMKDMSNEKRQKTLQRIFFHDVLNTAGQLISLLEMTKTSNPEKIVEFRNLFEEIVNVFIEEIESQKVLSADESGEIQVHLSEINSISFLKNLIGKWKYHKGERKLFISEQSAVKCFNTNPVILRRVINNIIKNALEACPGSQDIMLKTWFSASSVFFTVHNPGCIPEDLQAKIFQQPFSTKGQYRGLGIYSIKLLTKHYLKGKASFHSSDEKGTVFKIELPLIEA